MMMTALLSALIVGLAWLISRLARELENANNIPSLF